MPALRSEIPTVVPVRTEKRAGFAKDPVSSISRPVNTPEHHAIYEFELHARKCAICHRPYEVYAAGERLCERGHTYAQEVAAWLFNREGDTYSTVKEDHKYVRVEIQEGYDEVRGLLKAVERSLRHRRRAPFVSMDRSYFVAPRVSDRDHHHHHHHHPVKVEVKQAKRPLSGEIVDWPKPTTTTTTSSSSLQRRATVDVHNSARSSKRGSLYDADIAQQKRDVIKYRVEIREPSMGHSGYYR